MVNFNYTEFFNLLSNAILIGFGFGLIPMAFGLGIHGITSIFKKA